MKKQVVLSIALLMSLAGCKDKKKSLNVEKYDNVAQRTDVFSSVDIPLADNSDFEIQEDSEVLSFFDEDLGEFTFADDQNAEYAANTENNTVTDDHATISWVDIAHEESDLKTVYFGFNKYGVTEDQQEVIKTDIALLEDLLEVIDEDTVILVEGHSCHSSGSSAYNLGLSEKRAKYVADLLRAAGISPERIRIVGRGQEVPAIKNGKPVTGDRLQQAANRRVEIKLVENA